MPGFTMSERIERAPDEVFDFLTDVEAAPGWIPEITAVERLSSGPLTAGDRFRETRRDMGLEAQGEMEVAELERPRHYALTNTTSGVTSTYRYRLTPEGEGATRVDLACEIEAGRGRGVVAGVLARVMRRQDRDHLGRVKRALEAAPERGAGADVSKGGATG